MNLKFVVWGFTWVHVCLKESSFGFETKSTQYILSKYLSKLEFWISNAIFRFKILGEKGEDNFKRISCGNYNVAVT